MQQNQNTATVKQSLTVQEIAYLDQLSADIVKNGGLGKVDAIDAIQAAHSRRSAFGAEMLTQNTRRARMAKNALCMSVWHGVQAKVTFENFLRDCKAIAA